MEHCTKKADDGKEIPLFDRDSIEQAMRQRMLPLMKKVSVDVLQPPPVETVVAPDERRQRGVPFTVSRQW